MTRRIVAFVSGKEYGREAIETLMAQMTDSLCLVMIFVGYDIEMVQFLNINSGLTRRLKYHFSAIELAEITVKKLNAEGKRYPSNAHGQIVSCFSKLASDVTESHNAALCADFLDLVQTGQELRLWGNFSKCDKKDLRKYVESDFEYGISKFEERFVVFRDPKYKDVGVMVGQASMALTMEKDCLLYTSPSPRDKRQSRMPSSA